MLKYDMMLGAKFTIGNLPHFTWSRVKPTRLYMKKWVNFSHLANLGLEKGALGWRGVKSWPGCHVNANRNLFVDGLTQDGKSTRARVKGALYITLMLHLAHKPLVLDWGIHFDLLRQTKPQFDSGQTNNNPQFHFGRTECPVISSLRRTISRMGRTLSMTNRYFKAWIFQRNLMLTVKTI
jgi:hypothetical protein